MLPLIAITAGEVVNSDYPWAPVVHGQAHTYVDAVVRAGAAPVMLPIVDDATALRQMYDACDALLLSGGNDLDPDNYAAEPSSRTRIISPRRDQQEIKLFKWALEDDKPVLGICRGLQLINVALGGSLHQDVLADVPSAQNHESSVDKKDFKSLAHRLKVMPDSQLAAILGGHESNANSLHHQAISGLGEGLVATAYAEDGVIEAIELPGRRFVIAVQSHPEALEAETEVAWRKLFTAFVASAKGPKPRKP